MKGLLTGDLSVYIIQQLHTSIEKFQSDLLNTSRQIENILDKKSSIDAFYNENFGVGSVLEQSVVNTPTYERYQNFEQYLLLMEKNDWKKHIQLKEKVNYSTPHINVTQFVNADMLQNNPN